MESNEVLLTFEAGTPPDCVVLCSLSHSSGMLCSATHAGRVQLTSVSRNESKVLGHHSDAKVSLLKFSLKDSMILSGDVNGCIKVLIEKHVNCNFL